MTTFQHLPSLFCLPNPHSATWSSGGNTPSRGREIEAETERHKQRHRDRDRESEDSPGFRPAQQPRPILGPDALSTPHLQRPAPAPYAAAPPMRRLLAPAPARPFWDCSQDTFPNHIADLEHVQLLPRKRQ